MNHPNCEDLALFVEDKKAQIIIENSAKVVDDHYQLDMPFQERLPFPNN